MTGPAVGPAKRPAGSPCLHCLTRPARRYRSSTDAVGRYCSDRCRQAADRERARAANPTLRTQPAGSLCQHCQYRKARPVVNPDGKTSKTRAWRYCSERCSRSAASARQSDQTRRLLNQLRALAGLPDGGAGLTIPELQAIVRRVRALAPTDGTRRTPARRRSKVA